MLLYVGTGLVFVLIVFLGYVSTRPAAFSMARSSVIGGPANKVFALVNDFRRWIEWSPWEHLDPNLRRTFDGAETGAGAIYHWLGNKKAGEGRMTILESKANEKIVIRLEFIKPFSSVYTTTFEFHGENGGTRVVWRMEGKNNFMSKLWGVFMDIEKMIGKDFEKGFKGMNEAVKKSGA